MAEVVATRYGRTLAPVEEDAAPRAGTINAASEWDSFGRIIEAAGD